MMFSIFHFKVIEAGEVSVDAKQYSSTIIGHILRYLYCGSLPTCSVQDCKALYTLADRFVNKVKSFIIYIYKKINVNECTLLCYIFTFSLVNRIFIEEMNHSIGFFGTP